ncbi:hypothetical protein GCM10023354_04870 [Garicola koreensis]
MCNGDKPNRIGGDMPGRTDDEPERRKWEPMKSTVTAEQFDSTFDQGGDVTAALDVDKARRPGQEQQPRRPGS